MKSYTACIRTLGTAGEKYQILLESLMHQSFPPQKIIVYIAEGFPLPKETVGIEQYIYVPKGMVAQRALSYAEVKTEWMLLMDDDLYLPKDFVKKMFQALAENDADVISPDIYSHSNDCRSSRITFALSGRMIPRRDDGEWAYKILRTAGFSYNSQPSKDVYKAQSNAGACLLCKKSTFLDAHFEQESWMDKEMRYPLGEDQVLYYKLYLLGYKILTLFNSGIKHLDAGSSIASSEKETGIIFSDFCFRTVFWRRFIIGQETTTFYKMIDLLCYGYSIVFLLLSSIIKLRFDIAKVKIAGIRKGNEIFNKRLWERQY